MNAWHERIVCFVIYKKGFFDKGISMGNSKLYRKRFLPDEMVLLKQDKIVFQNENVIVTQWETLKPRTDFQKGISCYFLKKGYKISKFLKENDEFVYYYCDIMDISYDEEQDIFVFSDLLADVIEYENGSIEVVDIGEIADALEEGLITWELAQKALRRLDELLKIVYQNGCESLMKPYLQYGEASI